MLEGIVASIFATVIVAFAVFIYRKNSYGVILQLKKYLLNFINQIDNYKQSEHENIHEHISIISEFDIANHFVPLTAVEYDFCKEHPHPSLKLHDDIEAFILNCIELNKKSFFFIIGEFGTGKTALVTHILYSIGKKYLSKKIITLPILIPMSDIQGSDFMDESCRLMKEHYNITQFTRDFLIREVRLGHILLILDGLDEYMRLQGNRFPAFELKKLQENITQSSKIIITARPSVFRTPEELFGYFKQNNEDLLLISKRLSNFSSAIVLEIKNFSDEQINDAISKRNEIDSNFKNVIFENKNLHQLARQPILLDMLLKVLPNIFNRDEMRSLQKVDISGLYRMFISQSINRDQWKLDGNLLNENKALAICEKIALEMFNNQNDEVDEAEIIRIVNQALTLNREQYLEIKSIVDHIRSSLFLTIIPQNKYRYMHRSVMEFFVAKGLVNAIRNKYFLGLNLKRIAYHEAVSHFARSILKKEDLSILNELLSHTDPWVRFISAHYLSRLNASTAIKSIYNHLKAENDFIVRREFYIALAFLGKVKFFHNFIKEIDADTSKNIRNTELITEYFGSLASALEGCSQRLNERSNYPTREMIIKFLGVEGKREHIPIIRKYLNDKIESVGIEARKAVNIIKKRLGPPEVIKALLCDVDGVIVDSIEQHIRSWERAFQEVANIKFDINLIKTTEGMRSLEVAEKILNIQNKSLTKEKINEIVEKKRKYMSEKNSISVFPDTLMMIKKAKTKGLKIVLITASNKDRAESIRKVVGVELIDSIVSGDDTIEGKPSPEPYRLGLKKIDCLYSEAIAIENAPLGIDSAQSANIFCAGFTSTLSLEQLSCADIIINNPLEILNIIK
jgi:beta-phosphoglucomutase